MSDLRGTLRVDQAAQRLNVSISTIYRLIAEGHLPAYKIRGVYRVHPSAINDYLRLARTI